MMDPAVEFLRRLRLAGGWVRAGRKGYRIFVGPNPETIANPHALLDEASGLKERLRYLVTPTTPCPVRPRRHVYGRLRIEA